MGSGLIFITILVMEDKQHPVELPEKIFPVNYAGFWDFSLDGCYDASPLNEMDFPNAEQIAQEISTRYNGYADLKAEIERLKSTTGAEAVKELLAAREENKRLEQEISDLKEALKECYAHLQAHTHRGINAQRLAMAALSKFQPKKDERHDNE